MARFKKEDLRALAVDIHSEGYFYSEAYPLKRWESNDWPDVGREEYRVLDSYLSLFRLLDEYHGTED